jgi:Lon protease-like protein
MSVLLGLFPLNAVLFPSSQLPLHIFEERYKQLINECLRENRPFGVNLMESGTVDEIGCTARIAQVLTRYDDGRMDIVIEGKRRYAVEEMDTVNQPYTVGTVRWLDDDEDDVVDPLLSERVVSLYNELVEMVYGGALEQLDPTEGEGPASFRMGQKAGLDLKQRQHLLTLTSENERLRMLEQYLSEVMPKVREAERVQNIIRNDGYL